MKNDSNIWRPYTQEKITPPSILIEKAVSVSSIGSNIKGVTSWFVGEC